MGCHDRLLNYSVYCISKTYGLLSVAFSQLRLTLQQAMQVIHFLDYGLGEFVILILLLCWIIIPLIAMRNCAPLPRSRWITGIVVQKYLSHRQWKKKPKFKRTSCPRSLCTSCSRCATTPWWPFWKLSMIIREHRCNKIAAGDTGELSGVSFSVPSVY